MSTVSVPRRAENSVAIILATGPSLTAEDVAAARSACTQHKWLLAGVNDAYTIADLDLLYACDPDWWQHHYTRTEILRAELWSQYDTTNAASDVFPYPKVLRVCGAYMPDFSRDPKKIHYGSNSGFQAMNLVYLMGYTTLILLGYDCGVGPQGERHFFGEHPPGLRRSSGYSSFADEFGKINQQRAGVRILNATRRTYLKCFEQISLEAAIERAHTPTLSG